MPGNRKFRYERGEILTLFAVIFLTISLVGVVIATNAGPQLYKSSAKILEGIDPKEKTKSDDSERSKERKEERRDEKTQQTQNTALRGEQKAEDIFQKEQAEREAAEAETQRREKEREQQEEQSKVFAQLRETQTSITIVSTESYYEQAVNGNESALKILKSIDEEKYNQALVDRQRLEYSKLRASGTNTRIVSTESYYEQAVNGNESALNILKNTNPEKYQQALADRQNQIYALLRSQQQTIRVNNQPTDLLNLGLSGEDLANAAIMSNDRTGVSSCIITGGSVEECNRRAQASYATSLVAVGAAAGGVYAGTTLTAAAAAAQVPLDIYLYTNVQNFLQTNQWVGQTANTLKLLNQAATVARCTSSIGCDPLQAASLFPQPGVSSGLMGVPKTLSNMSSFNFTDPNILLTTYKSSINAPKNITTLTNLSIENVQNAYQSASILGNTFTNSLNASAPTNQPQVQQISSPSLPENQFRPVQGYPNGYDTLFQDSKAAAINDTYGALMDIQDGNLNNIVNDALYQLITN